MKKRVLWIPAGILMALAMPGFNLHFFVWIGFAFFLRSLDRGEERLSVSVLLRNTFKGLGFGLIFFGISLYWFLPTFAHYVPEVLQSFPPFMGVIVFILLILVEALFYGLFAFVYTLFQRRIAHHPVFFCLFAGLLLFVTEWLRGIGPMGFPGYRFSDGLVNMGGLSQIAAFGGTETLVVLVGVVNAAFYQLVSTRPSYAPIKRPRVLAAVLLLSLYAIDSIAQIALPPVYPENGETRSIAGMQTMVSSEKKYSFSETEFIEEFADSLQLLASARGKPDFIAFPEAHFMYDILWRSRTAEALEKFSAEKDVVFVVPHLAQMSEEEFYNAVRIVTPESGVSETFYGKRHLNPFVETLPFEKIFGMFGFIKFSNYFTPGPVAQTFEIGGKRYAFPVCFESFYSEVFEDFLNQKAEAFLVLTNDAWFTSSIALEQHFAQVRFRALETGKWVGQVSNNGITGVSDPFGRVVARIPAFERDLGVFLIGFSDHTRPLTFLDYRPLCLSGYGIAFLLLAAIALTAKRKTEKPQGS